MEIKTSARQWFSAVPAILAFAFFVVYLVQIMDEPFVRHLAVNPLVYDDQAHKILDGIPRTQPFFLSPLYPAFMALVYALTGGGRLPLLVTQGILLALNVGLLGAACKEIVPRRVSVAAMFGMTFYWSFYYFAGEVLPTTLCITFLLAGWLLFTRKDEPNLHPVAIAMVAFAGLLTLVYALPALRNLGSMLRGRSLSEPAGAYWGTLLVPLVFVPASAALLLIPGRPARMRRESNLLASGLVLGIGILFWSGLSLLAGLFTLSLLKGRRGRALRTGAFLLGAAVPIVASTAHNYLISGDFIPVTSSFGVNLFIGNNPDSDGMNPFSLGKANEVRIQADRLALSGAKRSAFFRKQAVSFIRSDPGRWIALLGRKALASVSRFSVDNNADISERRDAWGFLFLPVLDFGMIFPLGLAGIIYGLRDGRRAYLLVLGFVACISVGIVFFVAERFRIPAMVFLIPLAALGLFGLLGDIVAGRWRRLAAGIIIVGCGAALSNIDFLGLSDLEFASITASKAHVARLAGDLGEARKLAERALQEDPGNAGALFQLGAIEETQGNRAEAISDYLDCLDHDPFYYAAYFGAKRILETSGISPSYIDSYTDAIFASEPHEDLRRKLVEYVAARPPGNPPP